MKEKMKPHLILMRRLALFPRVECADLSDTRWFILAFNFNAAAFISTPVHLSPYISSNSRYKSRCIEIKCFCPVFYCQILPEAVFLLHLISMSKQYNYEKIIRNWLVSSVMALNHIKINAILLRVHTK